MCFLPSVNMRQLLNFQQSIRTDLSKNWLFEEKPWYNQPRPLVCLPLGSPIYVLRHPLADLQNKIIYDYRMYTNVYLYLYIFSEKVKFRLAV